MDVRIWSDLIERWLGLVFGERLPDVTAKVRVMRCMEEVLELAQSEGVSRSDAQIILQQVYDKAPGKPFNELGAVAITLIHYANQARYDLDDALLQEFLRIVDPKVVERVRYRNLHGDKIGIAHDEGDGNG